MERALSDEEKLRKAIEISHRRNNYYKISNVAKEDVKNNKKEYRLFKRTFIQIIICILIYGGFYLISNRNYIFSAEIIDKTNSILSYDVNIKQWYKNGKNSINEFISKWKDQIGDKENDKSDNQNTKNTEENDDKLEEDNNKNTTKINNNNTENSKKNLSQMEKDVEFIKSKYKFKRPIKGKVSSRFGKREILIKNMTGNHKGIDVAAKRGTKIRAAIEGQVEEASKNSRYGNFIKVKTDNILTVYAHCKKLRVKKGDKIKKGDVIATVGSTGVATGPHLHFEIRLNNRYINPELIIKWK